MILCPGHVRPTSAATGTADRPNSEIPPSPTSPLFPRPCHLRKSTHTFGDRQEHIFIVVSGTDSELEFSFLQAVTTIHFVEGTSTFLFEFYLSLLKQSIRL